MRAAKVQASLRIRAVSPEPPLLAHTSRESRGTSRQKARSLAPLNGGACAVEICHDGMLEDTNSLDGAQFTPKIVTGNTTGAKYERTTRKQHNLIPKLSYSGYKNEKELLITVVTQTFAIIKFYIMSNISNNFSITVLLVYSSIFI